MATILQYLKTNTKIAHLLTFAVVGGLSAIIHYISAIIYTLVFDLNIVISNVLAYFTALTISIIGHSKYSFKTGIKFKHSYRFFIVSLSAMGLSTFVTYTTHYMWGNIHIAFISGIVISAVYTYVLSRFFAFKG
jgi:putative flippase GtrA